MSTIDWRGLCEELVNALDAWQLGGSPLEDEVEQRLIDRARAALAQPEPEVVGPSTPFQSLLPLGIPSSPPELVPDELLSMWRALLGSQDVILTEPILALVQAAIAADRAHFGRPAPAPAGEVAELVSWLRLERHMQPHLYARFTRAADLLERQAAPAPVAVDERPWERRGWCDEHGWCWFGWAAAPGQSPDSSWSFCRPSERDTATVSLPAHALPLPGGEVE